MKKYLWSFLGIFFVLPIVASAQETIAVSNVDISYPSGTSVTITWVSTHEGDAQIKYAEDLISLPGAQWEVAQFYSPGKTQHSATLTNLKANTYYAFEIRTTNLQIGDAQVYQGSFTTQSNPTGTITISNLRNENVTESSATIKWTASANGDTQYRIVEAPAPLSEQEWEIHRFLVQGNLNHEVILNGLKPGTRYYYEVRSTNGTVGEAISVVGSFKTLGDPLSGSITSIGYQVRSITSVYISWDTNAAYNCALVLNTTPNVIDDTIGIKPGNVIWYAGTSNEVLIDDIKQYVKYYYKIICRDPQTNEKRAQSEELTFTNGIDFIMDVKAVPFDSDRYRFSWQGVIGMNCSLVYSPRIFADLDTITTGSDKRIVNVGNLPSAETSPLEPGITYYGQIVCRDLNDNSLVDYSEIIPFSVKGEDVVQPNENKKEVSTPQQNQSESEELKRLQQENQQLREQVNVLEEVVIAREKELSQVKNAELVERVGGKILLQVEEKGEAWYVEKETGERHFLLDGDAAYNLLRNLGLGISNENLEQIPIGIENKSNFVDSDGDGLGDRLEDAIGTNSDNSDSDGDGFLDGEEVRNGYNPAGPGRQEFTDLGQVLEGKILLQVESRGEAWYVHEGKRYYMKDGAEAYSIMRYLSLGITNTDIRQIPVADL